MNKKNIIYKAGVLLIAAVMVLSVLPAVSAETDEKEINIKQQYMSYEEYWQATEEAPSNSASMLRRDINEPIETDTIITVPAIAGKLDFDSGSFAPGDILFHQPVYGPGESWTFGNINGAYGYSLFENFWGVSAAIGAIRFVGIPFGGDPTAVLFDIQFYDDPIGTMSQPSSFVTGFSGLNGPATFVDFYSSYSAYEWEIALPADVNLAEGWIRIQQTIGDSVFWGNAHGGDGYSYQEGASVPQTPNDRALTLIEGEGGIECPPGCDFQILEINGISGVINSLPHTISIDIANIGDVPIDEIKLLVDIYEKICGPTNELVCDDLEKNKYDPRFDSNNENWSVFDDPADDADDLGDTWCLQQDDFHSADQAYRCTLGKYRSPGDDDVYVGRSEAIAPDMLTWHPANAADKTLSGAACGTFTFWTKAIGEFYMDEDGNVVPIDYGWMQISLDDGMTWITIPEFIVYNNDWQEWTIKFINTEANDGHYSDVCDDCYIDDTAERTIVIETDLTTAVFGARWMWEVDPCLQFEGMYIDDVCLERTEEYELELVHQTHSIISMDACVELFVHEFPLGFDPEEGKWYQIEICGQVFSPNDCEQNTENNCIIQQFFVDDVHDIACVGIESVTDDYLNKGDTACYEVTIENMGTFAENKVPVDLKVARTIVSSAIAESFESEPTGWGMYYFTGSDPANYFQWTEGIDVIVGPRAAGGVESLICADITTLWPQLRPNMGNLLTDDNVYDFSDLGCGGSATLSFSIKYALPATGAWWEGAWMFVHPTEGPDSAYWWLFNIGAGGAPFDQYQNNWVTLNYDAVGIAESFAYGDGIIPPIEIGWGLLTDLTYGVVSTPDGPWGGFMIDEIFLDIVSVDESTIMTVDTVESGALAPGDTQTLELCWEDVQYGNWAVIADTNLATDVNPSNDICCMNLLVADELYGFEFDSIDLTGYPEGSYWQCCNSRPPSDDNFAWNGFEFDTYGYYLPNTDDSMITPEIDLSGVGLGAALKFDTWYEIEYGYDYGQIFVRGSPSDNWQMIGMVTGYADWHEVSYAIPLELCTETTQFRFRFYSDAVVEDNGWYIDDVCIVEMLVGTDFGTESFEQVGAPLPPDWYTIQYSGTGDWVLYDYYSYCDPYGYIPGTGFWAGADSDENPSDVFDVGMFTESFDMTGETLVTIEFDSNFQDFAGDGEVELNVYSAGGFELNLYWQTTDDPYGGAHRLFTFDPSVFTDPSDVQFEFWYSTNGGTYAWGWGVDNVEVYGTLFWYLQDFEGTGGPGLSWCDLPGWTKIDTSIWENWEQYIGAFGYEPDGDAAAVCWWDYDPLFEWLISPVFDTSSGAAVMEFWPWHYGINQMYYPESDYVMYSTDGMTWNVMVDLFTAYPDGNQFADPIILSLPSSPTLQLAFVRDSGPYGTAVYGLDYLQFYTVVEGTECIFFEDFEDCPLGDTWIIQRTVAGDYWHIDDSYLVGGTTSDVDGDGLNHVIYGYPDTGVGLNNALYTTIELPDTFVMADIIFSQAFLIEEGCTVYIEISDDYDPADNMAESAATWSILYAYANPFPGPVWTAGWSAEQFSISEYLPELGTGSNEVTVRFRFTTPGEGQFSVTPQHGWAIDAFGLMYQEITLTDDTAPVSTLVFDDLTATVSLFAYDPVVPTEAAPSGVKAIYYKIDGGATQTYTGPFTLSEGSHVVTYWSEDNAGNVESQHTSSTLIVDTTPPTVSITAPEDALYLFGSKLINLASPLCIGKITIEAAAADAGGINIVTFAIDGDSGFDATAPYEYVYRGPKFGSASVTVTAYDFKGLTATASKDFRIFSLGLL
jgi:hypothetical protein